MASYPVVFDAPKPDHFDRVQVVLRLAILIVLSMLGGVLGWAHTLIWLGIPVLAAVLISQKGAEKYLSDAPNDMVKWLGYIVGAYAYLWLLTDKLPVGDAQTAVRFEVQTSGTPSVGRALLRIFFVIPHAIILAILSCIAAVLAFIAAIMILVSGSYPGAIHSFLRGVQRYNARVLAYIASLVDSYPPFSFDTGTESLTLGAAQAQS